jgi:hypothetical protein
MDVRALAENRVSNSDHDEYYKIAPIQIQKPFPATIQHAYNQKRPQGQNDVPQSAMNPSIEHSVKGSIFHGVEIGLDHFPEEVQEKGPSDKT